MKVSKPSRQDVPGPAIRVIVADDHAAVRRGLRRILEHEPDIRVVAEAATGREALALALEPGWDVLLLDISMPELSGLEVLEELREHRPGVAALVVSGHLEEQHVLRTLSAGALGYLAKGSPPKELVAAVRAVATGRRYISGDLAETLAGRLGGDDPRR